MFHRDNFSRPTEAPVNWRSARNNSGNNRCLVAVSGHDDRNRLGPGGPDQRLSPDFRVVGRIGSTADAQVEPETFPLRFGDCFRLSVVADVRGRTACVWLCLFAGADSTVVFEAVLGPGVTCVCVMCVASRRRRSGRSVGSVVSAERGRNVVRPSLITGLTTSSGRPFLSVYGFMVPSSAFCDVAELNNRMPPRAAVESTVATLVCRGDFPLHTSREQV